MEARALVQGHARTGSWMAIRVDLANDGPAFIGELRLVGGTQGRTRFAVPVDLPTTSRKAYTLHAQAPAFGSSLEIALVADETVVARRAVAFALHDPGQLVVGVVAERPGPLVAALGRLRDPTGPQPAVVQLTVDGPARASRGVVRPRPPGLAGRGRGPALDRAAGGAAHVACGRRPPHDRRWERRPRPARVASPTSSSPSARR